VQKEIYLHPMKRSKHNHLKWFSFVLFALYVSSTVIFTHAHVINKTIYLHSHPFKFGERAQHQHSENEYQLLDLIFSTTFTPDIIPEINLTETDHPVPIFYPEFYEALHLLQPATILQLRAPPAAA